MVMRILIWVAVRALVTLGVTQAAHVAKNAPEYQALCRLLRIAERGTKMPTEEMAKELSQTSRFDQVNTSLRRIAGVIKEAKKFPLEIGSAAGAVEVNITSEAIAQKVVEVISSMDVLMGSLEARLKDETTKVKEELDQAVTEFRKALVGAGEWTKEQNSYKTAPKITTGSNRATTCKAQTESGVVAGTALPVDMCCLCVPGVMADGRYMCGFNVDHQGTEVWASSEVTRLPEAWAIIYKHCEAQKVIDNPTPLNIESALAQFDGLLGRAAHGITDLAANVSFFFGFLPANTKATPACNGLVANSNGNGVCVDYSGKNTGKTEPAKIAEIKWRAALISAKGHLETADQLSEKPLATVQRSEALLWDVLREASITQPESLAVTDGLGPTKTEVRNDKSTEKGGSPVTGPTGAEGSSSSTAIDVTIFLRQLLLLSMALPH